MKRSQPWEQPPKVTPAASQPVEPVSPTGETASLSGGLGGNTSPAEEAAWNRWMDTESAVEEEAAWNSYVALLEREAASASGQSEATRMTLLNAEMVKLSAGAPAGHATDAAEDDEEALDWEKLPAYPLRAEVEDLPRAPVDHGSSPWWIFWGGCGVIAFIAMGAEALLGGVFNDTVGYRPNRTPSGSPGLEPFEWLVAFVLLVPFAIWFSNALDKRNAR